MTERFAADWLALREPFDHAARSVALARRLADRLPRRPRIVELAGGTGSLFRFLAPVIGRGQDWLVFDADAALLDEAFGRTAAWGRRQGFAATATGDTLLLSTPRGLWRMQAVQRDLGRDVDRLDANADAVVCSALLDLVSAAWLARLRDTLTVPFLACLTADGRDTWRPRHPFDALVRTAFHRDMRRDKGFGPALGVAAFAALAARGVTASAPSDWHIPRTALRMQRALIVGIADAARDAAPQAVAAWQAARLRQALRGRLAITIGHRDILALPPGG
ncbi:MAG: class I SAM-dependent methyltransferase [Acetobacteraceae bacterium]